MIKKMDPQIKAEWVADLRSGEIHKTKDQLRRGDRMCVLGVLCNVHAKHHPEIAAAQNLKNTYMGQTHTLPVEVAKWAKFNPLTLIVDKTGFVNTSYSLVDLNDVAGYSFRKIADLIEQQL